MRLEIYGNNYVVREGNEKITLFIGGDPYAYITGRVLFLKHPIVALHLPLADDMDQFSRDYKSFYGTVIINREVIDKLTVSF